MEKVLLALLPLPFGIGFLAPGPVEEPIASEVAFRFTDPDIVESSGLVAQDGLVVTVNDSGDTNRIFTVDPATGDTVGVTRWQGEADDIESLAPAGDGYVWVGDTGDNEHARATITVSRVPFGRGDREVRAASYELSYGGDAQDSETLLADPGTGRLYVVTKGGFGRVYAAPARLDPDGVNRLTPVDEVLGIATDGAFFPDGKHLVIRNYSQAAIYTWPGLDRVARLDLPAQQQGEGIAVSRRGEILLSSEGLAAEVLRVELPDDVRAQMARESASPSDPSSPDGQQDGQQDGQPDGQQETSPVAAEERSWWPWALGGVAGVAIIAVLVRSLRPR